MSDYGQMYVHIESASELIRLQLKAKQGGRTKQCYIQEKMSCSGVGYIGQVKHF